MEPVTTDPTVTGDAFEAWPVAVVGVLPTITCPLGELPEADESDGELARFWVAVMSGSFVFGMVDLFVFIVIRCLLMGG